VLVQTDPSDAARDAMLQALRRRPGAVRGVAIAGLMTPEATLEQLALAGVCGLRLAPDPRHGVGAAINELGEAALRAARRGWLVELAVPMALAGELRGAIADAPAPVVLTVPAHGDQPGGLRQPGLDTVLELLSAGRVWVKVTLHAGDDPGLAVLRALISTNAGRLVWGSLWPRPTAESGLAVMSAASGTEVTLRRILCDNPERLYGFAAMRALGDGAQHFQCNPQKC
jgi:predicted TIM-barrel fold metal-dependent hydrolase